MGGADHIYLVENGHWDLATKSFVSHRISAPLGMGFKLKKMEVTTKEEHLGPRNQDGLQ